MKKRHLLTGCVLLIGTVLGGCGNTIPEMSEYQEDAIAEYAAKLVLNHSKNYNSRLVDLSFYEEEEQQEEPVEESMEPELQEEPVVVDPVAPEDETEIDEETPDPGLTVEQAFMLEGFTLEYTGCFATDLYPSREVTNRSFEVSASTGSELVVLQFCLTNLNGEEVMVNNFSVPSQTTLYINGEKACVAMNTMLLDDLSTFVGKIPAGESADVVLLCELPAGTIFKIESMRMQTSTTVGVASKELQ